MEEVADTGWKSSKKRPDDRREGYKLLKKLLSGFNEKPEAGNP